MSLKVMTVNSMKYNMHASIALLFKVCSTAAVISVSKLPFIFSYMMGKEYII